MAFSPYKILNDFQICKSMYFKLLIHPMALSHSNICQKLAPSLCLSRSVPSLDDSAAVSLLPMYIVLCDVIAVLQKVKSTDLDQLYSYPSSKTYKLCDPRFLNE